MGKLTEYVEKKSEASFKTKHPKTPEEWIADTLGHMSSIYLATHVGKFCHPNANVVLHDNRKTHTDGYVTTENSAVIDDLAYQNAADMGPATFLMQPVEDQRTVWEHLLQKDPAIMSELRALKSEPEKWLQALEHLDHGMPEATFGGLRQVYFPVGEDYHLLTVLPASSLLEKVKESIESLPVKNDEETEYDSIPSTVNIHFGGGQQQNVSIRNNLAHGNFLLLPSLPPQLSADYAWKPKRDFFKEYRWDEDFTEHYRNLLSIFISDRNNKEVRDKRQAEADAMIDVLLAKAISLQNIPGWTDDEACAGLPEAQKYWLDLEYRETHEVESWEETVSKRFAQWIVRKWNRWLKKHYKDKTLHDRELSYFAGQMEKVLKWGGDKDEISSD